MTNPGSRPLTAVTSLRRHATIAGTFGNEWAEEMFNALADALTTRPTLTGVALAETLIRHTEGTLDV